MPIKDILKIIINVFLHFNATTYSSSKYIALVKLKNEKKINDFIRGRKKTINLKYFIH